MAQLTIHLQDGFKGDHVTVQVNGQPVYDKDKVTTQLLLGRADVFDLQVPEGKAKVTIEVPNRPLHSDIEVDIPHGTKKRHLGLSLEGSSVDHFVSD